MAKRTRWLDCTLVASSERANYRTERGPGGFSVTLVGVAEKILQRPELFVQVVVSLKTN